MKFNAERKEEQRSYGFLGMSSYTCYVSIYTVTITAEEFEMFKLYLEQGLVFNNGDRRNIESVQKDYTLCYNSNFVNPNKGYFMIGESFSDHKIWDIVDEYRKEKSWWTRQTFKDLKDREDWEDIFTSNLSEFKARAEAVYQVSKTASERPDNETIEL